MSIIYPRFATTHTLTNSAKSNSAKPSHSKPSHSKPSPARSHPVQRIEWQLALRELALQQSRVFPTFHQWLTQTTEIGPEPGQGQVEEAWAGVAQFAEEPSRKFGAPGPIDRESYQRWCHHVRTSLFIGFPIADYSEWCATHYE